MQTAQVGTMSTAYDGKSEFNATRKCRHMHEVNISYLLQVVHLPMVETAGLYNFSEQMH